ncbi:cutinase family protein [Mycobacterium intracellulare]|nr:cutinase family protein [Mycobacterium intracellulare]
MKTHRAARLVGLGASALVTAAGLLAAPAATPVASADDCPDVEVIFARGTNEPPGLGRVGDAFVDSLRQQTGGLNILPYGVNYAASKLQLHGGDGANDTIDRVKKSVEKCPSTKIVLGGYSQGASVMDIVGRRAHRRNQLGQLAAAAVRRQHRGRRHLRRRGRPRRRHVAQPEQAAGL